jgi:hypothetical protein
LKELEPKSARAAEGSLSVEGLGFDALVNRISSLVEVPPAAKQLLLEQDDLLVRAAKLEGHMEESLRLFRSLSRFRRIVPDDPSVN